MPLNPPIWSYPMVLLGWREEDPLFAQHPVYAGSAPADLSERHDDYLYGDKT